MSDFINSATCQLWSYKLYAVSDKILANQGKVHVIVGGDITKIFALCPYCNYNNVQAVN